MALPEQEEEVQGEGDLELHLPAEAMATEGHSHILCALHGLLRSRWANNLLAASLNTL